MRPLLRSALLTLTLACALAAAAPAQGLVQLTLTGEVERNGGARAEVEVTVAGPNTNNEARTLSVSLFLAERTSAADLAVLLETKLRASGARVLYTAAGQSARPVSVLFLEDVVGIALRLGEGLRASVTLCEDHPDSVRLVPPEDARQDAVLRITASTWQPHTRTRSRSELELRFASDFTAARSAELLAREGIRSGWPGEVERHETWRPSAVAGNDEVQGASFDLITSGDWRLEIGLAPRQR